METVETAVKVEDGTENWIGNMEAGSSGLSAAWLGQPAETFVAPQAVTRNCCSSVGSGP